jgi:hypothetical protein
MSLTRRLATWHRGSHWSAGPARPPAGATGLPRRPLVAPCHTPDHATCLSRRPAASPARHATHTRHQFVMPPARLWRCMPKPLDCRATHTSGLVRWLPHLTLRSPVLACCHVFSLPQMARKKKSGFMCCIWMAEWRTG